LKNTKREAWIAQRAPFLDVLITNPRKVETGLDLIQFANLVVYELTTSLFTLAQFVKRVWRLGQTQPVKTYYLVYRDTMEHRMLGLMAQKVMAAALLYGDNASSAMSAETDEEDLLAALAKAALNKLPIASGIEAVLAPMLQQDESIEMVDDVDAADLAAMFDAEEREDEQAAFDDVRQAHRPVRSLSMSKGSLPKGTTTTGARRNGGPGRIWPNSPAPKRRRSRPPPTCQTNNWTSSCWPPWLPPVQSPSPNHNHPS
jgi:hypothetical protein